MPCYLSTNMKRKGFESDHLDDGALHFTLSSPARKIRRLDADLPPLIGLREPEPDTPFSEFDGGESRLTGLVIEELPPENQERAIVLFKPINTPLHHSPSQFVVDSNLISSINEQAAWEINSRSSRFVEEEESKADEQLAVVPWVPSQQSHRALPPEVSEMEISEPMDVEETGATMEAEESIGIQSKMEFNQPNWRNVVQQHCMVPQPPHNTGTPIVWYR